MRSTRAVWGDDGPWRTQLQLTEARATHHLTVVQKERRDMTEEQKKVRFTKKVRRGLCELYPAAQQHLTDMTVNGFQASSRHDVEAAIDWIAQVGLGPEEGKRVRRPRVARDADAEPDEPQNSGYHDYCTGELI